MKQENLQKIVEIFLDEDRFSLEIWNQKEELIFFNTKSKDLCSSLGIDLNHGIKFTEYLQKHNLDYSDFTNFKEKDLNWYLEIEVDSRIFSISFKFYYNQFIIIYKVNLNFFTRNNFVINTEIILFSFWNSFITFQKRARNNFIQKIKF